MTWSLSKFRVGTVVEVRSKEEILATLDAQGCTDKLPFMPEMLRFCGQRFQVAAVAHKTCETAHQTWKARRIETTVHLTGTRCDGSAHGGCQADCNLFWKDSWLKPVEDTDNALTARKPRAEAISEADLMKCTRVAQDLHTKEPVYSCQATGLFEATKPLAWWEPRQYVRDVLTGNHSLRHVLSVLLVAFFKRLHQHAPVGYRATRFLHRWVHRQLFRRELPDFSGTVAQGQPTPVNPLHLKPGERVRIKSKAEIEATLDAKGRNRGLYFDVELSSYCGSVTTVRKLVTQFIDERTGKMSYAKQPCVMLDGVVCKSEYSACRLLCPRSIPSYWRETWLERLDAERKPVPEPTADSQRVVMHP